MSNNAVQFVGNVDGGISLYEDPYMEDNKVLHGRKHPTLGVIEKTFIIANTKTANIIYSQSKEFKKKLRKEKLNKINDIQLGN